MCINNKIKELRKFLKITQNEFGDRIGIAGSTISDIERGKLSPTERNISLICEKFNVNEIWLKTGVGEMFEEHDPETELEEYMGYISSDDDEFKRKVATFILKQMNDKERWSILKKMLLEFIKQVDDTTIL